MTLWQSKRVVQGLPDFVALIVGLDKLLNVLADTTCVPLANVAHRLKIRNPFRASCAGPIDLK